MLFIGCLWPIMSEDGVPRDNAAKRCMEQEEEGAGKEGRGVLVSFLLRFSVQKRDSGWKEGCEKLAKSVSHP
jgi:hypothetical protein